MQDADVDICGQEEEIFLAQRMSAKAFEGQCQLLKVERRFREKPFEALEIVRIHALILRLEFKLYYNLCKFLNKILKKILYLFDTLSICFDAKILEKRCQEIVIENLTMILLNEKKIFTLKFNILNKNV